MRRMNPRMQPWIAAAVLAVAAVGCEKDLAASGTSGRIEVPTAAQPAAVPSSPVGLEIAVTTTSPEALTAFKRGRYLVESGRIDEGTAELIKAVKQDKQF